MAQTNGSICDDEGNLMLYFNGMRAHNGLHRTVPGLDTISYSKHWENFNFKDYCPDGSA